MSGGKTIYMRRALNVGGNQGRGDPLMRAIAGDARDPHDDRTRELPLGPFDGMDDDRTPEQLESARATFRERQRRSCEQQQQALDARLDVLAEQLDEWPAARSFRHELQQLRELRARGWWLEFEAGGAPLVWTGVAADERAAEQRAREELSRDHPGSVGALVACIERGRA
jgi:hypothetical protein